MNLDTILKQLSLRADQEKTPKTHLAQQIITHLRTSPSTPVYAAERPLMWLAGFSSVVAVSVVIAALVLYFGVSSNPHPLGEVMETISWASVQ